MKIINNCLTEVLPSDLIDGKFIFPPEVDTIATRAFQKCAEDLIEVQIPDNVFFIGTGAFANCIFLKEVKLPSQLREISESVFENCSALEELKIPDSVKRLGAGVFSNCTSLKNIKLPKDLKEIYYSVFLNCTALEEIEFGDNINIIYPKAFENCQSLKEVKLPETTSKIYSDSFLDCKSLKKINIPEAVDLISANAFKNCSQLENITLPPNLIEIGNNAFENCTSLKSISIPESVVLVGNNIFYKCESLENAEINNHEISLSQFSGCKSLKEVSIPNINKLSSFAFFNCESLEKVTFQEGVKTIGMSAFSNCVSLKSIDLPEGLETIEGIAFLNCKNLERVNIPSSTKVIGKSAFNLCDSLTSLHIPETVESMETISNDSLSFFNKTEDGFYLSEVQTPLSIPTKMIDINYTLLSKYWNLRDILLKEQKNPKIVSFYNDLVQYLPKEKAEKFIQNHNFTFFKKIDTSKLNIVPKNYYKLLYNLGAFEPPIMKENGKTVDYAQKVVGFILDNLEKDEKFDERLNEVFHNMKIDGFKPEFTDFFLKNYFELLKEENNSKGFISKCYNDFEKVQRMNTSNRGSQRQLKPTIEKFKENFALEKFEGITEENSLIAQAVSTFFNNQLTFENALQIDNERRKKKIPDNILKTPIKEKDVFESIDEFSNMVFQCGSKMLGSLTDIASNEFSFEWLQKNDPENFILGKLCSCCAHLEGMGYGIMHASIVHPNIQNLVIRNKNGEIVAKSTLFINKLGRYGVCNNVEVKQGIKNVELEEIYQKFVLGIREFAKQNNKEHPLLSLKQINVGMGNNDLVFNIQYYRPETYKILKTVDYKKYGIDGQRYSGDSSGEQYIIWSEKEEKELLSKLNKTKNQNPNEMQ